MSDVIVIGAGPAGLTAGIYLRRAGKSVTIIEKGSFGGQMTFSPKIENYPAFGEISGNGLADRMVEQALLSGVEFEVGKAVSLYEEGSKKAVMTENGDIFKADAVIIASGAAHRHLNLKNEEEYIGNGISFCAVCDGAFYKGKDVIVVGGGNSAMQEALLLAETSRSVTMIQNLGRLTGEELLCEKIRSKNNIEVILDSMVRELIIENGSVNGIRAEKANGESFSVRSDGIFVAIGLIPENKAFESVAALDGAGYFDSDESCTTKTPGVFVAGDCRRKSVRQITTAVADGASAAVAAVKYLG